MITYPGLFLVLLSVGSLAASSDKQCPAIEKSESIWVSLPALDPSKPSKVQSIAVAGNDVYAGGFSRNSDNVAIPGYWKNGIWVGLKPINASKDSEISFIMVADNNVYAAGSSTDANNEAIPGYWKNGTWNALKKPEYSPDARVLSLAVSANDVYASGCISVLSHPFMTKVAAHWKNGILTTTAKEDDITEFSTVNSLAVAGTDIIEGGFQAQEDRLTKAGYWKNGHWVGLTPMNPAYSASVNYVTCQDKVILGGGYCLNASGNSIPGYWENGTWLPLPSGDTSKDASVTSLAINKKDIYAGGTINCSTDVNTDELYGVPGYWLNKSWNGLKQAEGVNGSWVSSMVVSGGQIYLGGWALSNNGIRVPGYWKATIPSQVIH